MFPASIFCVTVRQWQMTIWQNEERLTKPHPVYIIGISNSRVLSGLPKYLKQFTVMKNLRWIPTLPLQIQKLMLRLAYINSNSHTTECIQWLIIITASELDPYSLINTQYWLKSRGMFCTLYTDTDIRRKWQGLINPQYQLLKFNSMVW